jgi:hypothetical protein
MFLQKELKSRGLPKNWIFEEVQNKGDLTYEMKEKLTKYMLSLHGIKEATKEIYLGRIRTIGAFLAQKGSTKFEDVNRSDVVLFLSNYGN